MKHRLRVLVSTLGVLALALGAPLAHAAPPFRPQSCDCTDGPKGKICPLKWIPLGQPAYTGVGGTGSFFSSDLVAPEPIPFEVQATDTDTLFIKCGKKCKTVTFPGVWTANWTRSLISGAGDPGAFVDPRANLVTEVDDATTVLYLPPKDLSIGETRSIRIKAEIVNTCSCAGYDDPRARVKFRVDVARIAQDQYVVGSALEDTDTPPLTPSLCVNGQSNCDLLDSVDPYCPPIADIVDYPAQGMVLGEMRSILGFGEDLDRHAVECGTHPGDSPVESNFGYQAYCDELMYTWTVVAGPGGGVFTNQGRSTIFRATQPGTVTVQLLITGTDGEIDWKQKTFIIHEPRVVRMAYGGSHPIAEDKTGNLYVAPHWRDNNADGDAEDPGERRISAVYTRGTSVQIERVFIECSTKVPPYGVIRGFGPDNQAFRSGAANCTDGTAASTELYACTMTALSPLPNVVKKYDPYHVDWRVQFNSLQQVDVGGTETWLYVTFATPTPSHPAYETTYDISCIGANGASSEPNVANLVWGVFQGGTVKRKARDGYNVDDGKQMGYWVGGPGVTNCSTMPMMLADPAADGQCGAWAQLLRACWQAQGIDAGHAYVVAYIIPATGAPGWMLIKNWTLGPPYMCVGPNGAVNSAMNPADAPGYTTTLDPHAYGMHLPGIFAGSNGTLESIATPDDHVYTPVPAANLLVGADLVNAPGIGGQNKNEPPEAFLNHFIVVRGGLYYDPSYKAGPFASANDHENAALDALSPTMLIAQMQNTGSVELFYHTYPALD